MKDLETKVDDLEKSSESANHENGLLRAQVEKLQIELKEYRKRLSTGSANVGRSPPLNPSPGSQYANARNQTSKSDFQFEFPQFGDLPGSHIFNNGAMASLRNSSSNNIATTSSSGSSGTADRNSGSISQTPPQVQSHRSSVASPLSSAGQSFQAPAGQSAKQATPKDDALESLFSPSILAMSRHSSTDYFPGSNTNNQKQRKSQDSGRGPNGVLQYGSSCSTDSPSASSESQHGASSSNGTSPEPLINSPPQNKLDNYGLNTINEENTSFGPTEGMFVCDL